MKEIFYVLIFSLILLLFLPFLFLWSFFGWIFTSSPRITAIVSLSLVTFSSGFVTLFSWNYFIILQYFFSLLLFFYSFLYRLSTRVFKRFFLLAIFLCQFILFLVVWKSSSFSFSSDSTLSFSSSTSRNYFASLLLLLVTINMICVIERLWLPVSQSKYLQEEERYLFMRCNRKLNRMLVASLGTIEVTDEFHPNHLFPPTSPNCKPHSISAASSVSKPILVLLHSYGSCNSHWVECLSPLQSYFRVYCVELYGFGRSSRGTWGRSWHGKTLQESLDLFTTSLENWRDLMEINKFSLLCHSFSCYVGLSYTLKYPQRISLLYFLSPLLGIYSISPTYSSPIIDDAPTLSPLEPLNSSSRHIPNNGERSFTLSSQRTPLSSWLSEFLWESSITPMDFLRWLGPLGPCLFHSFISSLLTYFPVNSRLRSYSPAEFSAFTSTFYQQLSSPPYGEKCLPLFMDSYGYPKISLLSMLSHSLSPHSASLPGYGTFDHSSLSNVSISQDQISDLTNIRIIFLIGEIVSPSLRNEEVNRGREREVEAIVQFLRFHRIYSDYFVIEKAGYFVQLDNPIDLCEAVINADRDGE